MASLVPTWMSCCWPVEGLRLIFLLPPPPADSQRITVMGSQRRYDISSSARQASEKDLDYYPLLLKVGYMYKCSILNPSQITRYWQHKPIDTHIFWQAVWKERNTVWFLFCFHRWAGYKDGKHFICQWHSCTGRIRPFWVIHISSVFHIALCLYCTDNNQCWCCCHHHCREKLTRTHVLAILQLVCQWYPW